MTEQERADRGWPSTARVALAQGPFPGPTEAAQGASVLWMAPDMRRDEIAFSGPLSERDYVRRVEGETDGQIGRAGE